MFEANEIIQPTAHLTLLILDGTNPGAKQLTVIPLGAKSAAIFFVK